MNGHGGKRSGAGRKRLIDVMLAIQIGSWCENRKRELREDAHWARKKAGSALWQEMERAREDILARLENADDPLDRSGAAALLEAAGERIFGNKTQWGKHARFFQGLTKLQLCRTWSEEYKSKENILQTARRECRERFQPQLRRMIGPKFDLTDRRIEECERQYKAFRAWEETCEDSET